MSDIVVFLQTYPQIVIFLSIAIGYWIGRLKIFGFNLGSTAGVLLTALFLGQLNINVPSLLEAIMFALFIFCIGYRVGPEFFNGVKKDGIKYILLAFFIAIVALVTALVLGKVLNFSPGTTAGLLGGAMTQSTIIGTADEAIKHLAISTDSKSIFSSDLAIAYAVTYVFGTAGLIVFFKMAPRVMGIDLKAESRKLEQETTGSKTDEVLQQEEFLWNKIPALRIYSVKNPDVVNKTGAEIKSLFKANVAITSIKRNGKILSNPLSEKVQLGDLLVVLANPGDFFQAEDIIGPEVYDEKLGSLVGETLKICVLNKDAIGKTLNELKEQHGYGCFFRKLSRQEHEIPLTPNTVLKKCDELEVIGPEQNVEKLIDYLGYPERPRSITDMVLVGLGCAVGTMLGLISIRMGYIPVGLGIGGGILVAGLVFGWLRSLRPTFGTIPAGAQWILTDLGLNLFVVCVGLTAAPKALHALQQSGLSLFFAGAVLSITPMVLGIFFGKYVLKISPALLFGALTGAGTITAALNAVKEEADSSIPTIGYTVPYAFGNVILTVFGTLIVYLM